MDRVTARTGRVVGDRAVDRGRGLTDKSNVSCCSNGKKKKEKQVETILFWSQVVNNFQFQFERSIARIKSV